MFFCQLSTVNYQLSIVNLATPDFRFKQFTIRHDRSAMKVGTDGVLLGAWAQVPIDENSSPHPNVLDVGTGTGLIALMLAQRFPTAKIVGIDIDEASIEQARDNVENTPFKTQISILEQDFLSIDSFSNKYDAIVSNPPFYTEETLGGKEARDKARHTTSLPFETLVKNATKLLTEGGFFSVIIPFQSAVDFISICVANRLYLIRRLNIRSKDSKPFKRVLLEFSTSIQPTDTRTLTLYDAHHERTPEYTQLTKDFYL